MLSYVVLNGFEFCFNELSQNSNQFRCNVIETFVIYSFQLLLFNVPYTTFKKRIAWFWRPFNNCRTFPVFFNPVPSAVTHSLTFEYASQTRG